MFDTRYESPFSGRYGSVEMQCVWSEYRKRYLWRKVWVALAKAQAHYGLIPPRTTKPVIKEMERNLNFIDVEHSLRVEEETKHDLVAELQVFSTQCGDAGRYLHLGATSSDIQDNADALRTRKGLGIVAQRLETLLDALASRIEKTAGLACLGYTHLQLAEPTTVGYRLAQYTQDLLESLEAIKWAGYRLRGKGFKGAVGTSASFGELFEHKNQNSLADWTEALDRAPTHADVETFAMAGLGLNTYLVTTQVCPRKQEWELISLLAGVAGTLHKFALDVRLLQSMGEWSEPFGSRQVGSSAMPHKRNPINSENICSLARLVAALPRIAWDNMANSALERTLDDSANRRVLLPQAFLAVDEMLSRSTKIVRGLEFNKGQIAEGLSESLAGIERILIAAVARGGNRATAYAELRNCCQGTIDRTWENLSGRPFFQRFFSQAELFKLFYSQADYVGDAEERALLMAGRVRKALLAALSPANPGD